MQYAPDHFFEASSSVSLTILILWIALPFLFFSSLSLLAASHQLDARHAPSHSVTIKRGRAAGAPWDNNHRFIGSVGWHRRRRRRRLPASREWSGAVDGGGGDQLLAF